MEDLMSTLWSKTQVALLLPLGLPHLCQALPHAKQTHWTLRCSDAVSQCVSALLTGEHTFTAVSASDVKHIICLIFHLCGRSTFCMCA